MIVNPQLFNYRLIISSLIVALAVLSVLSFTNYKSIKSHEQFLEQEKHLIESELSEMLDSYEGLNRDYNLMSSQLQEAKTETRLALDSLRLLKSDLSIVSRFKQQLIVLKSKNKVLLSAIDSLNYANQRLEDEKRMAINSIEKKDETIAELVETNASLNETIDKASLLTAARIDAQAYKKILGKKRYTARARKANAIDVCITLSENPLTEKGEKEIYVQIVNPRNNVVADKGSISFGSNSLIYSNKEIVDYNNEAVEICTSIVATKQDEAFMRGYYFINVFHKSRKIGSTTIELK